MQLHQFSASRQPAVKTEPTANFIIGIVLDACLIKHPAIALKAQLRRTMRQITNNDSNPRMALLEKIIHQVKGGGGVIDCHAVSRMHIKITRHP